MLSHLRSARSWRLQGQIQLRFSSTSPKSTFLSPSPDLKHIRLNPGLYSSNCIDRNYPALSQTPFAITAHFERWKKLDRLSRPLREEAAQMRKALARDAYQSIVMPDEQKPTVKTSSTEAKDENSGPTEPRKLTAEEEREQLLVAARATKAQLDVFETEMNELESEMHKLAVSLPNLSSVNTPVGTDPIELDVYRPREGLGVGRLQFQPDRHSQLPSEDTKLVRSHTHIGSLLQLFDFSASAVTSGWGWYFLTHEAAIMEQAIIHLALNAAIERGFKPVSPPSIVYGRIAAAAGFQPRDQNGERQIYTVGQSDVDGVAGQEPSSAVSSRDPGLSNNDNTLVLAGTAEIPLAGMKANTIGAERDFPDKVVGVSRCFRAEAGARGADTRGLYRVHEFTKVEMFAWTLPALGDGADKTPSEVVLDEMIEVQKHVLTALHLPFRVLEQPTADLGASAARKIDIEAWFPGRDQGRDSGWGEVTSASNCTDYQSRRLGTRIRTATQPGSGLAVGGVGKPGDLVYAHTCNGTAAAIPRLIAALVENGWDEKRQAVWVPTVLRPYLGGREWITKREDRM